MVLTMNNIEKDALLVLNQTACLKQEVYAMIKTPLGEKIYGGNFIQNNVGVCPRDQLGFKSGEGYHLCSDVCNQVSHAEVDAIKNAMKENIDITGSTLFLVGHTYCCDECLGKMANAGISQCIILNEKNESIKNYIF